MVDVQPRKEWLDPLLPRPQWKRRRPRELLPLRVQAGMSTVPIHTKTSSREGHDMDLPAIRLLFSNLYRKMKHILTKAAHVDFQT